MKNKIRVLVVDDSALMRKMLSDILSRDDLIEVVGTARDGLDAMEKIRKLEPDVVTMDIEMPKMDGLTALQHIMNERPMPVIIVSAMDKRQADVTMKALDYGAVDFISKTSGTLSLDIDKIGDDFISKVKMASTARMPKPRTKKHTNGFYLSEEPAVLQQPTSARARKKLVIIGASTGGPKAIPEVLSRLPRNIPAPVLVVQHMPEGFTKSFADRLNWYTSLEVAEAAPGDIISPGKVLVAPGNYHMEIGGKTIKTTQDEKVNNVRPSVDVLMKSAAKSHGAGCIGVLLTGMGGDGAEGLKAIKAAGGKTIAQDEETCVVFGMPKIAMDMGVVDVMRPLDDIAKAIIKFLED